MIPGLLLLLLPSQGGTVAGQLRAEIRAVDAVVYLVPVDSAPLPPPAQATIDQRELRFVPRVVVVPPGSTVDFLNSDALLHNVFSPPRPGPGFNLGVYPLAEHRSHLFAEEGGHVVLCHVHPEMLAYVVVLPSPYWATADPEGRFRLDSIPPGRYRVQVWHRRLEFPGQDITVGLTPLRLELLLSPRRRGRKERHPE